MSDAPRKNKAASIRARLLNVAKQAVVWAWIKHGGQRLHLAVAIDSSNSPNLGSNFSTFGVSSTGRVDFDQRAGYEPEVGRRAYERPIFSARSLYLIRAP